MTTIRATEVTMELRLVVEYPEDALLLNIIDLGDWVQDQLNKWIVLPFDNDTRALLETDIETNENDRTIDYELDPICHTHVKDRIR